MTTRHVIIEMRHQVSVPFLASTALPSVAPVLAGIRLDPSFEPVAVPSRARIEEGPLPAGFHAAFALGDVAPAIGEEETYILRGIVEDGEAEAVAAAATPAGPVVGIYADVAIHPLITCGGSPAVGDDKRVESLLCVPQLQQHGMNGEGVYVAIVDTGFNLAYLNSKGKSPAFDKELSWVPRSGLVPGELPVNHGTMCAFDVCIAAPKCTLLDVAVLLSQVPGGTVMEGLLSDAVRAYSHLRTVLPSLARPKALVVSNSWGMFHPSWDYPVGHPGNYSDNPNHPFNRIVRTLEREGADIVFAAGNCGNECPDGRCGGVTNAIYGANSHPKVLCVAGVDTNNDRVGYSTKGPGRLSHDKPDISGYTHFKGSGVYPADSGTSAATPVVAGVLAALRTRFPYRPMSPTSWPSALRRLIERTAIDRGQPGYDFEYGWGIINSCKLAEVLVAATASDESRVAGAEPVAAAAV